MHEIFHASNFYVNPYAIPHFIISFFLLALGIFVYRQNRRSVTNLSYLLVCLSASLWLLGDAIIMSTKEGMHTLFWVKFVYIGITFIPPSLYFFIVSWSDKIRQKKKWIIFNYVLGLVFIILLFATDRFVIGYQKHFFGNFSQLGRWGILFLIYFLGVSGVFFYALIKSYLSESDAIKKIQKRRILIAFLIAFMGATEFLPTYGVSIYPMGCWAIILFFIIVAHTIIRYKLMDIETVLHKTIAWVFTNLMLIIPFVVIIYFTRSWYMQLNNPEAFIFLGTLLLAFLFCFTVFQPRIDHLFQRRRYNLEGVLRNFTDDITHLKGITQLIKRIEDTIAETLYPQSIGIFIYDEKTKKYNLINIKDTAREGESLEIEDAFLRWLTKNDKIVYKEFIDTDPAYATIGDKAKEYCDRTQATCVVPLVLNEWLLGIINLGKKANLRRYAAVDFNFLTTLKNQCVIAISNSLLYENIEEQVRQRTKELVEVQQQLIQAEKLATVGTLAGGVAHEINNPLTAVLTNAQILLASDTIRNESDRESLQLIEEASKRCRTIVKKLMVYARKPLESTELSKVNLLDIVKNAISFIGYQLEQESITIVTDEKEEKHLVLGKSNELEQVVTNLILNAKDAIKRMKKSGKIFISLSKNNTWVNLSIRDEGIGMSEEIRSKIFDPFFTTKDVGKGLGLGLSICQAIVERYGGTIAVDSEVNKGSTFTIQLPAFEVKEKIKT